MISVVKNIPAVSLSENPITLGLQSDDFIETEAENAIFQIELSTAGCSVEDNDFSIEIDGVVSIFTVKTTPETNGYEIPKYTSIPVITALQYSQSVANYLKKNYYLYSNFDINAVAEISGDVYIRFVSREKKPYEISIDESDCLTDSTIESEGATAENYDFYKLLLQVLFKDSSDIWQIQGEDRLPVDDDGNATFNLESYFADQITGAFTYPESIDNVLIVDTENFVKEYKYRYAEIGVKSGDTFPRVYNLTESSTKKAIKGGVGEYKLREYSENDTDFWSQLQYNLMFLTWQPKTKTLSAFQTEKLFFLINTAVTSIKYVIKAYYDGGSSTFTRQQENASIYNTIEVICSPAKIDFPTYVPGEEIIKYEVWLENEDSERISEKFYYILDYTKFPYQKEFIFRNSLGVYECLRCIGLSQKEIEFDRILFDVRKDFDFYYEKFNTKQLINEELEQYTANTGLVSRKYLEHLRELHFSEEVYEIANNKLFPIVITNKKLFLQKDSEYLYNMEITYARAYTNKHFTPDPSIKKDDYHFAEPYFNESFSDDFITN